VITDLEPYPAYKDSGVEWLGEVPEGWEVRRLGSITTPVSRRGRQDLPLLSVLREKGVILREEGDANHNVVPEDLTNYKVVNPGDLVINKMKAWQGSLGVATRRGIVSPAYFVFGLHEIGQPYAHVLLRSRPYVGAFAAASDGIRVNQWDLSMVGMKAIPALIPPHVEQSAIVRFLDYANARIQRFIAAQERLVEALEEEKQAIVHRAITRGIDPDVHFKPSGADWLGDVPAHWEVRRLKWAIRLQRGYDLPADERLPGGIPVISSGGIVGTHAEARAKGPGVVMGRYGSTGSVYFVDGDFWPHNTSLFVTHFYGNEPGWAFYLLQVIPKAELAAKSAVPGIDRKDLHDILISVPPVQEQRALIEGLAQQTETVANAMLVARRQVDLLREYRTRLISDVVTGKLDVREAAESIPEDPDADDPALDERLEEVATR
jgi:type I restriction enzyme, S subunit